MGVQAGVQEEIFDEELGVTQIIEYVKNEEGEVVEIVRSPEGIYRPQTSDTFAVFDGKTWRVAGTGLQPGDEAFVDPAPEDEFTFYENQVWRVVGKDEPATLLQPPPLETEVEEPPEEQEVKNEPEKTQEAL